VVRRSVERAVRADVRSLGVLPAGSAALVSSAVALGRLVDAEGGSAAGKAACARSLRETMDRLRELAPRAAAADTVDALSRRRSARRSGLRAVAS
jgi:hypothetical protein